LSAIRPSRAAWIAFDELDFLAKARPTNATAVVALASSIRAIGLQNPPTVIERAGRYLLIAGRHRLEALRVLGEERVPVRVVDFDDIEARLWQISENLHRTELHPVHGAEQIAEFAKLTKERLEAQKQAPVDQGPARPEGVLVQLAPKPQGGRPESGDRLVARELGITREEVWRSQTIAAMPDEVKARAVELGRGGTQAALLRAAKERTPGAQVEALERRGDRAAVPIAPRPPALRNLENIAAGELARWIKLTTPNSRRHVIRLLQDCADILERELKGIADGPSKANGADEERRARQ
jgi:ParB-like chromosome segregation protein Spo0J